MQRAGKASRSVEGGDGMNVLADGGRVAILIEGLCRQSLGEVFQRILVRGGMKASATSYGNKPR